MNTKSLVKQDPPSLSPEISVIAKGAGIVFFGGVIGAGLRFLFQIWVARYLGSDLFGIFLLGLALIKVVQIISEFGLTEGVVRYVALFSGQKKPSHVKGVIYSTVKTGLIVSALILGLLMIFSDSLIQDIFNKARLSEVLKIFALMIPFSTFTTLIISVNQGLKEMKPKVAVRDILEPALRLVLAVLFIMLGWSLTGVVIAYCLPVVFSLPVALYFLNRGFPPIKDRTVRPVVKTRAILAFSLPLLVVRFFSHTMLWIDTLMLGYFSSPGMVGVYGAAQRTILMGSITRAAFNSIFSPFISDLYHREKYEELETIFKIISKWIFSINLPFFVFLIIFSDSVMNLFGGQFLAGQSALFILSIGWIIFSSAGSMGEMITMSGRSKLQFINMFSVFILNIVFNMVLIPRYGFNGAAAATAATMLIYTLVQVIEIRLIFKMHPFRCDYYKPLLSTAVAAMIIFLLKKEMSASILGHPMNFVYLAGGGVVFFGSYILSMNFLGLGHDEKYVWQKIKRKIRLNI